MNVLHLSVEATSLKRSEMSALIRENIQMDRSGERMRESKFRWFGHVQWRDGKDATTRQIENRMTFMKRYM